MRVLLVGMYDTNTVSLAPHILKQYVEQFNVSNGFEIITCEFSIFNDSIDSIVDHINGLNPDVVGFSAYVWNINEILEIVKHIESIIVLGGPQVTGIEKELLARSSNVDIIVTGEGEETFKEIFEYLSGIKGINDIRGITTREFSSVRNNLIDLDSIPSPYRRIIEEHSNITWICLETSRGCPMNCKYCTWGFSRKMRYFSLDRVKADLDIILSQDNIREIYFCDSSLLLNKKRAKTILKYIIDSGTNKSIRYEFAAEQLDDELIDLMVQLSYNEFNLGLQSINERALENMSRKLCMEKFEENYQKIVKKFKRTNITVDLMYGLPGDDIEGYKRSLNYVISLDRVKRILTNPLIVLPGSEFYKDMTGEDKYKIKLKDSTSYLLSENYTFSQTDMELAKKYSFFVSVVYLNYLFRDCIKLYAEWQNMKYIDAVIKFMETLPFYIGVENYPDMIPSVKEGFQYRNASLKTAINRYGDMVDHFKVFTRHKYDDALTDIDNHYSDHYYKLRKFVGLNQI